MFGPLKVQLDATTVVGLLALLTSIITVIIVPIFMRRDHYAKQVDDMARAQGELENQITNLNGRVNRLYDENGRLRGLVRSYMADNTEQTEYIRGIGHWMDKACEVLDVPQKWLSDNPKPHLPDDIRKKLPKSKQHIGGKYDSSKQSAGSTGNTIGNSDEG